MKVIFLLSFLLLHLAMRNLLSERFPEIYQYLLKEDPDLLIHQKRVTLLSFSFGRILGLSSKELELLETASQLHDLGKTFLPLRLRQKPAVLSPDEWKLVHLHPLVGAGLVFSFPDLAPATPFILTHHERPDGNGYPLGLKDSKIPFLSKVLTLCDAVCAMLEDRPYSKKKSLKYVLNELEKNAGTQFDPELVEYFIRFCAKLLFKFLVFRV